MVVGYSLGNRNDVEDEVLVLGEDDPNVITYSKTLVVPFTRQCRNSCGYCGFNRKDNLVVPYSTIKMSKKARSEGVREVLYVAGERPDKYPHIRANLDLWGFGTYIDYVYSVCELGFLEGLIPVVELGFMTPQELRMISEVSALVKVMLDSVDADRVEVYHSKSPGKKLDMRVKTLEWTGKLGVPCVTGIMVGIGETHAHRRSMLDLIADIHGQYGHIHEVHIQNFHPQKGTLAEGRKPASRSDVLKTVEYARSVLPETVPVTAPLELNTGIEDFIKAGVRDLGRIFVNPGTYMREPAIDWMSLCETIDKLGFRLQQRFPLRRSFIQEGLYSKKLGQVFDSYRYKIKKEVQEKLKESKGSSS